MKVSILVSIENFQFDVNLEEEYQDRNEFPNNITIHKRMNFLSLLMKFKQTLQGFPTARLLTFI